MTIVMYFGSTEDDNVDGIRMRMRVKTMTKMMKMRCINHLTQIRRKRAVKKIVMSQTGLPKMKILVSAALL